MRAVLSWPTQLLRRSIDLVAGDAPFRRLFANASKLLASNAVQGLCGLLTLGLTARALRPDELGTLVVASGYATVVGQVVGFQAWHAIVKYGAGAWSARDDERFGALIKLGYVLDGGAAIAAAVIACLGVWLGANFLNVSPRDSAIAYLFAVAVAFNISGTPTAILRVTDRYRSFILHSILSSAVKLVTVIVAFWLKAGVWGFAWCWVVTQVFSSCLLMLMAHLELKRNGLLPLRQYPIRKAISESEGILSFFVSTNLNGSARVLRDLDTPLIGVFLGPAAAGSFKLARQLATLINRIVDPFFHAIYPDLSRLHSVGQTSSALALVRKSSLTLGMLSLPILLGFLWIGEPTLTWLLGAAYSGVYPVAVWCIAAAVVWAFAQPLPPMLLAAGQHRALLVANVTSTVLYLLAVPVAVREFGPSGAGATFFGYFLAWTIAIGYLVARLHAPERKTLPA